MEFLNENLWLVWLIAGIFFLIVEIVTTALVSIWFVPAAAITCGISFLVDSLLWQTVIFILFSAVFMIWFRRIYKKRIKKPVDEISKDTQLENTCATATEPIDAHNGRVLAGDVYWRAVTENGEKIEKGETVVIRKVKSTTLIVEREKN